MLATLMPLFDENMAVKAFSLFAQKENYLLNPSRLGTGVNDGAANINGMDVIENAGIETLSEDADIFISLNNISIFSDIDSQCNEPKDRLVFLLDNSIKPEDQYIKIIKEYKDKGYRFAIRKLLVADFEEYKSILSMMDYIFLDYKRIEISKAKIYFSNLYPNLKLVAVNLDSQEIYEELKATGGYSLYEGEFYRLPIKKGENKVAPVKATYVELLNTVNVDDFDLTGAADIIGRDTALVVSLLKMVNKMTVNNGITTIRHAAAMLGQKELKKWINTVVAEKLCEDKPGEITRVSLIRAKFAENIAASFDMAGQSAELFLMGLFSVLDVILNQSMDQALSMVKVSKPIENAILRGKGDFAKVLDFIKTYERADWAEISRIMLIEGIEMDEIYKAYLDSLRWYRELYK